MKHGNPVLLLIGICLVYLTHHAHAWPLLNLFHGRGSTNRYTGNIALGTASPPNYETDEQIKAEMKCPEEADHNLGFVFWCEMERDPLYPIFATQRMRDLSAQLRATNIWDCFPAEFICTNNRGQDWFGNFIDRVSGIYADHVVSTGRQVFLITDEYDNGLQWPHTVFGRVERPTLEQGGVNSVILVDGRRYPPFNSREKTMPIGALYNSAVPSTPNKQADKVKTTDNTDDVPYRFNWEGFGDDPGGSCPVKYAEPGPVGYSLPAYTPGLCFLNISQTATEDTTYAAQGGFAPSYDYGITVFDSNMLIVGQKYQENVSPSSPMDVDSLLPLVVVYEPSAVEVGGSGYVWEDRVSYGAWDAVVTYPDCVVPDWNGSEQRDITCHFPCQ